MTHWIRQLFRTTVPVVKSRRTTLGLQQLEERETPATFIVTTTADSGAGSLRDAVAQANTNQGSDTITFATGLGPVVLTSAELTLTDTSGTTTMSGPSGGTQAVQRSNAFGTPEFRVFSVIRGVTANLDNLIISNGKTKSIGGGIYNAGALTITNSTISANYAGGFYVNPSVGGGICNDGTLTLTNSTVSANIAEDWGGGIFNFGTLTVTNSTVSANIVIEQDGGGISNRGTLTASNSTFSANIADRHGGGVNNEAGSATLTNCTISGNTVYGRAGGINAIGGLLTLTNVTVTKNRSKADTDSSTLQGGGLYSSALVLTPTLNNTLIAGNFGGAGTTADDVAGVVASTSANNLIGSGGGLVGITNGSQGNMIGTSGAPMNPLLQPLANNGGVTLTHALGQNSPALGKGSASVANYTPFDQRGASRDNGTPDIGAYEVNHPLAPVGVPTTLAGMFQPKPSASANEAFVKGLYQSTLLRAPDSAGLAGWVSQLNGGTSRSIVANGFVNSTENRQNQVTFFYRYFLKREPDNAGLNGWVGILQSGTDEGQVMTGFILSNEFSGLNNNSQFVNLMYYALLSRKADTAGFNGWVNALNAGQSRGVVVNAFLRSEEGLNRVIDSLFQTYLKRNGTTGDLSAYRTFLNSNTFGQAATSILASAEFFTNAGNNLS